MTRFLTLVYLAAATISAVSAAAVSAVAPSPVTVSEAPLYSATPVAVSNSTLEDRSAIEARGSAGFAQSCTSWGGEFGQSGGKNIGTLAANCRMKNGGSRYSTLDLNKCIVNDGGNMRCQTNGGFLNSCRPTNTPVTGSPWLHATCSTGSTGSKSASFDLNTCVGNNDGYLVC